MKWEQAYVDFVGACEKKPGSDHWTMEEYKTIFEQVPTGQAKRKERCNYCLASVWISGGYHIDRIDSGTPYIRGNVVPCCVVCNMNKRNNDPNVFAMMMAPLVHQYPDGVPWQNFPLYRKQNKLVFDRYRLTRHLEAPEPEPALSDLPLFAGFAK